MHYFWSDKTRTNRTGRKVMANVSVSAAHLSPCRAVLQRLYDWKSLLASVLQPYRSTVSEATDFMPSRLAFGRKMRLPVDPQR